MSIFVHGQLAQYAFPTSLGVLDVVAEVSITGVALESIEPVVYAGDGTRIHLGVRAMLEIA